MIHNSLIWELTPIWILGWLSLSFIVYCCFYEVHSMLYIEEVSTVKGRKEFREYMNRGKKK
jgi:hypothetical protein